MKKPVIIAIALAFVVEYSPAQTPSGRVSPSKVVEQYLELAQDGALLTSDGWRQGSIFFSALSPEPENKTIFVTTKHAGVGEVWVKGNRAEVHDAWWDLEGSIDGALQYSPPPTATTKGSIGVYHLVLTKKHWEIASGGQMNEVTGPSHWEIEGPQTWRWTTVEAALRYVNEMSAKSTDPTVKQNAEKTIAILGKLPR